MNGIIKKQDVENFMKTNLLNIIIVFFCFLFIYYIITKIQKRRRNCKLIAKEREQNYNSDFNEFYSYGELINSDYFKDNATNNEYKLKDFYFKTAHNCFCSGNYKNDYVHDCALSNCASYGVRALDMEIYSKNNKPIIAASSVKSNFYKETYNHISLENGIAEIKKIFIDGNAGNQSKLKDHPLFLNLRIRYGSKEKNKIDENNKKIKFYNKIYEILTSYFDVDTLNQTKMKLKYPSKNEVNRADLINNLNMKDLSNTIFIFITLNDEPNTSTLEESNLIKITDLYNLNNYRYEQFRDGNNAFMSVLNNDNLSICLPSYNVNSKNEDFLIPMSYGIQFVGMNYQTNDNMLYLYNSFFLKQHNIDSGNKQNTPYIKKPDHMTS